jgi:hypothetical protein
MDLEEGVISEEGLLWTSYIDGELGSGIARHIQLSPGTHLVSLYAQDDDGDGDIDCSDSDCVNDEACYFKVTGTVRTGTGQPIKNAEVYLVDASASKIILETHSNENGNFEIDYSHLAEQWGMPALNPSARLGVELADKTGQVQVLWDFQKVGKPYFIETTDFGHPTKTHFDMTMKSSNTLWSFGSIITGYDTLWDAAQIDYDSLHLFDFVKNNNTGDSFIEGYAELQKKWPGKAADIDEVFVAHGFFKDTNKGNGKCDLHEPYWDEDPDGKGPLPNGKWDTLQSRQMTITRQTLQGRVT